MDLVVPSDRMRGDDDEDTRLLKDALREAEDYLASFKWCRGVKERYFGIGVGGVVTVFLFRIDPADDVDEWLWVVCGDLPTAYLVTDEAPDPIAALEGYCSLMEEWIQAVRSKGDFSGVFPVQVAPTEEHASMLEKRVILLRTKIFPLYRS